ncbi:MAG: hypothetical protein GF334_03035 [Candidatus Altiarchaeales archaeon]|nr:hypothetical protein [Candidatus Altiarchaeales archaeon]
MAISEQARTVIQRPLDRSRVKSRAGGQGMSFDYIPTEYAIELLNEAFDYAWDSRVFFHEKFEDSVIVGVELKTWEEQGNPIIKQQFGSCKINRGVDMGSAFKGAASDGLKKCASQFGLALELYRDDDPEAAGGFKPPQRTTPNRAKAPAAPPAPPARPPAPAAPPRPPADRETRIAPPAGPGSGPPRPPAPPASKPNPFAGQGNTNTAPVSRPAPPPTPPAPPKAAAAAAPSRPNPFAGNSTGRGINSTQMSALNSLANKKGVSQPDLIALAQVTDEQGHPKQTFEELTHSEAIQVIKAAQK